MSGSSLEDKLRAAAGEQDLLRLERSRRTLDEWKRTCRNLARDLELAEARCDAMLALRDPVDVVKIPFTREAAKGSAVAGAVASDWHVGERVERAQVAGLNRYAPEIAAKRSQEFFRRALRMVEIQRHGAKIDTFVLALLGDMITGYIHEDLRLTNTMSPTEEVRFCRGLLTAGIDYLLEHGDFNALHVPCCYGNHGRTNPGRPLAAAAARNSYEVMLYCDLRDHYAKDERVRFHIAQGPFLYLDVGGYVIRCTHGDTFRYGGGIGGLTVPLVKAIHRWNTQRRADLTIFGHWHTFAPGPSWIGNGSMIGMNAWAAQIGVEYEPAMQSFFLIDLARRRRTLAEPIFLEGA